MKKAIRSSDDILEMLDAFFPNEAERWNKFFTELSISHPLASILPDEYLVSYLTEGRSHPGMALDIGCGNGRNAIYLANKGFQVDALDLSKEIIVRATRSAMEAKASVRFTCSSLFDFPSAGKTYDLVYDSGLLHHIFPHRRPQYIQSISSLLRKGGHLIIVAFNEKMGAMVPEEELYQCKSMEGGLSYSSEKLDFLLEGKFNRLDYRNLKNCQPKDGCFGFDFLFGSLWEKI